MFGLGIRASARAGSSHALGLKSSPARRSQNQLDGTVLGACGGTGGSKGDGEGVEIAD